MFGRKKKLYKITYGTWVDRYTTIIEAKDEFQAIKKFRKMTQNGLSYDHITIISFEEYQFGK